MKKLIIIWCVLVLLRGCHYSCFNCTGPQYVSCMSCANGTALTAVEDPATIPKAYWSSVYQTGTCVDTMGGKANPLGIILFIVLAGSCILIGSKESFYLFLTLQTFGLYNLVDIAWVNPIGYVLQGLQYLMIWNVLGSKYKGSDYTLSSNKYYRLNTYLQQSEIAQNIALIAAFTLLSLVLLVLICVIAVRRKKQQEQKEEAREEVIFENMQTDKNEQMEQREEKEEKKATCMEKFSEKVLIQVAKFLLSVLFMMVQETSLVLLVSLVFNLNKVVIVLSIIYLHILIFEMSYAYYYRVEYFTEKNVMYVNFAKKVILPIMVVVPINYQFLLFLFAAVFLVVEVVIDCYNGLYQKMSRLLLYKGVEILITVLLIVYYLVEQSKNSYSSSRAASIACTFAIAFYLFLFVAVELPIGIKERFFSGKGRQENEAEELKNPIEDTLNDINEKQENFQVVQMNNSNSDRSEESEAVPGPKPADKLTKDDNSSVKHSIAENNVEQPVKPEPAKKKRRKQILDKELRMRYGI